MGICHCFCHLVWISFSSVRNPYKVTQPIYHHDNINDHNVCYPTSPATQVWAYVLGKVINQSSPVLKREAGDAVQCECTGSILTRVVVAEASSLVLVPWRQHRSLALFVPRCHFPGVYVDLVYQCSCRYYPWLLVFQACVPSSLRDFMKDQVLFKLNTLTLNLLKLFSVTDINVYWGIVKFSATYNTNMQFRCIVNFQMFWSIFSPPLSKRYKNANKNSHNNN